MQPVEGGSRMNSSLRQRMTLTISAVLLLITWVAPLTAFAQSSDSPNHQYFRKVAAFKHRIEAYKDSADHYNLSVLLREMPGFIDTLDEYIHSDNDYAQQTAIEIAGSTWPLNDKLLDVLIAAKSMYNKGFIVWSINALERVGLSNPKVLPALVQFAELDKNSGARGAIARLCEAEKDSIPIMLTFVKYAAWDGWIAIRRLDTLDRSDPRIVRGLIEALHENPALDRECAAEALGHREIMLDEILPALASALRDNAEIVRYAAGEALLKFGRKGLAVLIKSLQSDDIYTRTSAIDALEKVKPLTAEMEDAFIRCLKDSNDYVRATAAAILERVTTRKAREAMAVYQEDEKLRKQEYERESQAERNRVYSLAEICSPIPPDANYKDSLFIRDSVPVVINGDTMFLLTVHVDRDRPDRLSIWKRVEDGYRFIDMIESDGGDYHGSIAKPVIFHFGGETFIYIENYSSGNGGWHDDSVYVVTGGGELQPVDFVGPVKECYSLLRKGETIMNGVYNYMADDTMSFAFDIWEKDDSHCCPTGGTIEGTYKLEKSSAYDPVTRGRKTSYRIVVDRFQRVPPTEDEQNEK